MLEDRLVFLSGRELKDGVVIVGIDVLSELERLAHQLSLRDRLTLREGALSNSSVHYTKDDFSLETLMPVGTKTIVFTITRNTEQFYTVSQTAQNVLMMSLLFIGALLTLTTIFVVRNIANPIHSLSTAAHEIANADFTGPFKPRSFFDKNHNPFKIGLGDEIGQLADTFTHMEKELYAVYSGLINDLKNANKDLNEAYDATLQGWSSALELRDHETEKHTSRVTKYVQELARYMGVSERDIINIRRGAFLHDVGKMAIPDHILQTESPLMGRLTFAGSTTMQPLVAQLSEVFRQRHPQVILEVAAGGSVVGIQAVHEGTADIGMGSRALSTEEAQGISVYIVGYDAIVLVVHPDNPVKSLTLAQLQDIYMGRIINWTELGGNDLAIIPIQREVSSGTRGAFDELALEKQESTIPSLLTVITAGDVAANVATQPAAIGYVGFGNIESDLKVIAVDGTLPSQESIHDGTYPLFRPLSLLTGPFSQPLANEFLNFVLSPEGQAYVEEFGWIPVTR